MSTGRILMVSLACQKPSLLPAVHRINSTHQDTCNGVSTYLFPCSLEFASF